MIHYIDKYNNMVKFNIRNKKKETVCALDWSSLKCIPKDNSYNCLLFNNITKKYSIYNIDGDSVTIPLSYLAQLDTYPYYTAENFTIYSSNEYISRCNLKNGECRNLWKRDNDSPMYLYNYNKFIGSMALYDSLSGRVLYNEGRDKLRISFFDHLFESMNNDCVYEIMKHNNMYHFQYILNSEFFKESLSNILWTDDGFILIHSKGDKEWLYFYDKRSPGEPYKVVVYDDIFSENYYYGLDLVVKLYAPNKHSTHLRIMRYDKILYDSIMPDTPTNAIRHNIFDGTMNFLIETNIFNISENLKFTEYILPKYLLI